MIDIALAPTVNSLVKAGIAGGIGTRQLGLQVAAPMALSLTGGLLTAWLI